MFNEKQISHIGITAENKVFLFTPSAESRITGSKTNQESAPAATENVLTVARTMHNSSLNQKFTFNCVISRESTRQTIGIRNVIWNPHNQHSYWIGEKIRTFDRNVKKRKGLDFE